jgi:hypothetical protein
VPILAERRPVIEARGLRFANAPNFVDHRVGIVPGFTFLNSSGVRMMGALQTLPTRPASIEGRTVALARSLYSIDQIGGGFRSQFRIAVWIKPQSSSCNALSRNQGGSQPNEMS